MKMSAAVLGTVIALLSSAHTQAKDRPAALLVGEQSIEAALQLPKDLPRGTYEVFCESLILKIGRASRPQCYWMQDRHYQRLVIAVRRAIRKAHYSPAIRNGVSVDAYMLMMAIVTISDQEPLVLIVPNNGVERNRYGLLYTAPQRVSDFYWHKPSIPYTRDDPTLIWAHLTIDANGKITDKRLENATNASAVVVRAIDRDIEKSQFMPGEVDGQPMPMRYIEPWFSR